MLRPTLNIGHGNFIADNPNLNYSVGRDLDLLGEAGATYRTARSTSSAARAHSITWKRTRSPASTCRIGSDTYPRDMIMNMRTASYLGKVTSHIFRGHAGEVFAAATLGGARSVGRETSAGWRPARSPTSSLSIYRGATPALWPVPTRQDVVECGIGDDVDTVIVDGRS